jgi:hypothetical protein
MNTETPASATGQSIVLHTPGPWCVESVTHDIALDICREHAPAGAGDPVLVAFCHFDDPSNEAGDISVTEAEANARLMAAAPELLAACKALMPEGWDEGHMDHMPGIKLARIAIAKAEGRS